MPGNNCENQPTDGAYLLDVKCQDFYTFTAYYYPGVTQYFNVSLVQGNTFSVNETECNSALSTVLNGCPPFSAPNGQELAKYGGSVSVADGQGNVADFMIVLKSATAVP